MSENNIISRCLRIANSHFLNSPYIGKNIFDLYTVDVVENKASSICHYCTVGVLKSILNNGCLRFTDVRFLNDSTEFTEIIPLIECVLKNGNYEKEFTELLLNSNEYKELKEYRQLYRGFSRRTHDYDEIVYHTYTCSFSTDHDSLSMWNYYATSASGVNVVFDHSWNMFEGSSKTDINNGERLSNDIIIYRGLILYNFDDKKKCLEELFGHLSEVYKDAREYGKEYLPYILYAFRSSINHMRAFFKNEHFSEEKEYRIVLKIPDEIIQSKYAEEESIKEKGFFQRGNVLIPYVDYKIKRESIKEITLNPYVTDKNTPCELGIKELLYMNDLQNVRISHSNIPIRWYD